MPSSQPIACFADAPPSLPPPRRRRSTIYNMCTQKPPYDYSEQLYARYREAFNTYIDTKVRALARVRRAPFAAAASRINLSLQRARAQLPTPSPPPPLAQRTQHPKYH